MRPLALVVQDAQCWSPGVGLAKAFYRFIDLEVIDLYRFNSFQCADMVLAPQDAEVPSTDDIEAGTVAFYRSVSLLRLASSHRLTPPELRILVNHMAGLDAWYREFGSIFEQAAEAFYRRTELLGCWEVTRGAQVLR
ncbi:MAG TPA: hypothetical protein VHG28_19615 [Longimicrobiaceae bacterium]|nr:hypothetical protein [Longimicrobiaceae bacterium]